MSSQEVIDVLHELLVVDTEEGLVENTNEITQGIYVRFKDGSHFLIEVVPLEFLETIMVN